MINTGRHSRPSLKLKPDALICIGFFYYTTLKRCTNNICPHIH